MAEELPHNSEPDANTSPQRPLRIWMAVSVVLVFGVAGYLAFRSDPWGERARVLPASFQLGLEKQLAIQPDLIRYRLRTRIALPVTEARAIASGPDDRIYVAGDQAVYILNSEGEPAGVPGKVIALTGEPTCLAIGGPDHLEPGRLYVGTPAGIEVFDAGGRGLATWPRPNEKAVITAIAVAHQDVFLADAGNRVVWRYNLAGEQLGQIGQAEPTRQVAGLVIPSLHFDVVVATEDLLYVVNPGKLQILAFTFAGDLGAAWGRADSSISGFFGCCNPTHLALLPDGRLVTSEKGIPRVKVYNSTGALDAVVATPQQLGISRQSVGDPRRSQQQSACDIAADSLGRVLVLDPRGRAILVFVEKDDAADSGANS